MLVHYLEAEIKPAFEALGFSCHIFLERNWPFLFAERIEDSCQPTVLGYGHGDVIHGLDDSWENGLSPWQMIELDGRWYGRGVADNKGQHSINMGAIRAVLETRGKLGFNAKYLIEMGEERISPGLREFAHTHAELLRADVLIASDGPRLSLGRPTIFLGSRGAISFDIWIDARAGGHHSGNWGGLLSDPAIQLAHALACITGPRGQICIPEWRPQSIPDNVRQVLADCEIESEAEGPAIDTSWGEPGLTPAENCSHGARSRSWLSRREIRRHQLALFRRGHGRAVSCALSLASIPTMYCPRFAVTLTDRVLHMWRSRKRVARFFERHASTPTIRGSDGQWSRSIARQVRTQQSCRALVHHCRTTSSPRYCSFRQCGCHIPIRRALNMRQTNIFLSRLLARALL